MKHRRNQLGWQKKFRVTNQPKLSSLYYFPQPQILFLAETFILFSRGTFHLLPSRWRPCHWQTSNYWKEKNLPCHNHPHFYLYLHLYLYLFYICTFICICICICIFTCICIWICICICSGCFHHKKMMLIISMLTMTMGPENIYGKWRRSFDDNMSEWVSEERGSGH